MCHRSYAALTPATTLVTFSIGGNDADFANILKACTQGTVAEGVLDCTSADLPEIMQSMMPSGRLRGGV
jgi:hypothetical protein